MSKYSIIGILIGISFIAFGFCLQALGNILSGDIAFFIAGIFCLNVKWE